MGMNSMNRTCSGSRCDSRAKSRISSSLIWRMATILSLTGEKPRAKHGLDTPPDLIKTVDAGDLGHPLGAQGIEADVHLGHPGILQFLAYCSRSTPLVVMRTSSSPSIRVRSRIKPITPRRTSGSPPVSRTLVIPMATATRTTRSSSS